MNQFQLPLFYDIQMLIQHSNFYRKYNLLFSVLDLSGIPNKNYSVGRTGYSRHAIIKSFIIKHLERIKTVPELIDFLDSHPALCIMCGFEAGNLPDETQFYRFLKQTPNSLFQKIHHSINKELIDKDIVSTGHFILDSKPVMAATKQNNFKNPNRDTKNRDKKIKRNPNATLSYYSYQKIKGQKDNFMFFWGYRTHVLISKEGIPLVEITLPNNIVDQKVAYKLIKKLKRVYGLKKQSIFIADAAYDAKELYNFIVTKLKCKAYIPLKRKAKLPECSDKGIPLCKAGYEMKNNGIAREKHRTRIKYRCPLKLSKEFSLKHPQGCTLMPEKFKAYGCVKNIDITDDPRAQVPRDSKEYKDTFKLRTEVERYFSRLGDREAEQSTHYTLRSVKNQMTIAHLTMSLIALTAADLLNKPDKIRCYRTFVKPEKLCLKL